MSWNKITHLNDIKRDSKIDFSIKAILPEKLLSVEACCKGCTKVLSFSDSEIKLRYSSSKKNGLMTECIRIRKEDGETEILFFKINVKDYGIFI